MLQRRKKGVPTSVKMKLYADMLLTFAMGAMVLTVGLPLPDRTIKWINFSIGLVGIGGKLLTNMVDFKIKEEEGTNEESASK